MLHSEAFLVFIGFVDRISDIQGLVLSLDKLGQSFSQTSHNLSWKSYIFILKSLFMHFWGTIRFLQMKLHNWPSIGSLNFKPLGSTCRNVHKKTCWVLKPTNFLLTLSPVLDGQFWTPGLAPTTRSSPLSSVLFCIRFRQMAAISSSAFACFVHKMLRKE